VALQLGFTDVERRALRKLLVGTLERDRYPLKTGALNRGRPSLPIIPIG
jgi:hypothetical protein